VIAAVLVSLLCQAAASGTPAGGTVVDGRSRLPIFGAEVAIVGHRGAVRTDSDGRFRWTVPPPPAPVTLVVILPDGRVARPIRLTEWTSDRDLVLVAEPAIAEGVTISGAAASIDNAPAASTTLLPRADLEMREPVTLSQALENVPGVSFIAEGQGAVPAIRGLARGRSLTLIDGSRVSTERRAGANASFLDPAAVDSVEVARGPASVAYGSDAFGGVIAVRTRRAAYGSPLSARIAGTAGAGIPESRADVEVSRGYAADAFLVGVRAREFDDYRAPTGTIPNSGWRDGGVSARWDHDAGERSWSIGWQTGLSRDIGRPRSDTASLIATTPYEDSHRLSGTYEKQSAAWFRNVRLDGMFGVSRERTQQDRVATPRQPRNLTQSDMSSREVQLRLTGDRALGPVRFEAGADLNGRYGLEAIDTTVAYNQTGAIASIQSNASIVSAHRTDLGIFGQADAQVSARVRLAAGLRGDSVRNDTDGGYFGVRQVTNSATAGFAGATFVVTPHTTLTAQIARGFRDPTLTDRFYRGPSGRGFVEGNPDLLPETSRQVDLMARWELRQVRVSGAYYDYRISNLVERYLAGSSDFFFRNRGAARIRGAEIEAQAALPAAVVMELSAQVSRGTDAVSGTPIDDIAPRSVTAVLRRAAGTRLGSYLRVSAIARHDSAGPSEVPTPGVLLIDAGSAWHWSARVEMRAVVRNLLDRAFYSSAGPRWVYAPGRNGSITFAVAF
jgi:outer membrane receptor protein involved in Fe transport